MIETTGSLEAWLEALRYARRLADAGVAVGVEAGDAHLVSHWTELHRATTCSLGYARRLTDNQREALAQLRASSAVEAALIEQAMREFDLRSTATATTTSATTAAPTDAAVAPTPSTPPHVESSAIVQFVDHQGQALAVVRDRGEVRLVDLGAMSEARNHVQFIAASVQRLNTADPAIQQRALASLLRDAAALDSRLFGPLELSDGPVVVVPTGALHGVLWRALPTLQDRAFSVAPALSWWLAAADDPPPANRSILFVAGPGLPGADEEVARLAALHPDAAVLTGSDASVEAVLRTFERVSIAHIAAHGITRHDNPMFSQLRLADGPLTLYDWGTVTRAPELVVLAACEAAAGRVFESDGVLGTATAVLELGSRSVVAPLAKVADGAARRLMIGLHEHLRAGSGVADALTAAARAALDTGDPHDVAAAVSFAVFGRGWPAAGDERCDPVEP
ncbi:MAG: CHAT domain-containing protein [Ilumatobacteraceae bacterium]